MNRFEIIVCVSVDPFLPPASRIKTFGAALLLASLDANSAPAGPADASVSEEVTSSKCESPPLTSNDDEVVHAVKVERSRWYDVERMGEKKESYLLCVLYSCLDICAVLLLQPPYDGSQRLHVVYTALASLLPRLDDCAS